MGDRKAGATSRTRGMADPAWPFDDEAIVPLDEAALLENHDLIDAILNAAEVSGPAMSLDEFKAWLDQQ